MSPQHEYALSLLRPAVKADDGTMASEAVQTIVNLDVLLNPVVTRKLLMYYIKESPDFWVTIAAKFIEEIENDEKSTASAPMEWGKS
jgi:hypothetical protein